MPLDYVKHEATPQRSLEKNGSSGTTTKIAPE